MLATVSLQAAQSTASQKPFVADLNVPIAVGGESQERSFTGKMRGANAVLPIAGCLAFTRRVPFWFLTFEDSAPFDTLLAKNPEDPPKSVLSQDSIKTDLQ